MRVIINPFTPTVNSPAKESPCGNAAETATSSPRRITLFRYTQQYLFNVSITLQHIKNHLWDVEGYNLSISMINKDYTSEINFLKDYYNVNDGILFWFLKTKFLDILSADHDNINCVNFRDYEKLMDNVLLDYTAHPSAWKNEFMLYRNVKAFIPDTIYQAQPKWLKPQSLDINIEPKSIGIEYQGIQHFHPVDYFGGENGYLEMVQRDEKKMQKCNENGVQLLYWNYQVTVTKLSVEEFLRRNKII